jgi:selenocysteine-specific elongation factor
LRDGLPVHLHLGTADVVGRIAVLSGRAIEPGQMGFVQVDLEQPIGALHGDRAVLRDHAARNTLAGGRVVDAPAPRRGRRTPQRLALLEAMAPTDPALALRQMLAVEGYVDLACYALLRNLAPAEMDGLADSANSGSRRIGSAAAPFAVTVAYLAELTDKAAASLAAFHQAQPDMLGPTRTALLTQMRDMAREAVLDAALTDLAGTGRALREGGMWHLPDHRPRLTRADAKLWERARPLLSAGELRPPRVREIAAALTLEPDATERFLNRAARLGHVAKVAENRFFLPETVALLAAIARDLADEWPSGFSAAMFNDRSGVGRNLTIQILEHLDRIGATRRVGDVRVWSHGPGKFV